MQIATKERPILFSAPMVRALLDGSKTQTRRVVKMPPSWDCVVYADWGNGWWPYRSDDGESPNYDNNEIPLNCPYGQPGDILWVRESWHQRGSWQAPGWPEAEPEDYYWSGTRQVVYAADSANPGDGWRSRPSIHMPRWASRILLEVVSVRVERLQDIGEADARAEGVTIEDRHTVGYCAGEFLPPSIRAYRDLWEQINGAGTWDASPWVWVVEFKRVSERT